ncbi:Solute carrier (proton/amino acid symporter), TRAMD3 or PAT1 [Carpediemonas membranifera]|uniref:Cilia- and flagella-associated protein 91 n=1 Tax=Carpediemonas membranifera TaxID=201153 RepID=A0A8J6AQW8_9EUKA|nr:Solute carrier (proton/amino acid symporter), TRAMD3 or PAT1 [Carpediemonas membranifera]|eukprot:KAG9391573.1 Solute carrier (proton/amino acid symporter), TRAMD3 or PAT1 [Carpediemonas membranifera]
MRSLYFRRPLIPSFHEYLPAEIILAPPEQDFMDEADRMTPTDTNQQQCTVGIQTDYRESAAQTDPWEPDVDVPEGQAPEVLGMKALTVANGLLPAHQETLRKIDWIREREKKLASQPDDLEGRLKILSEVEVADWQEREAEIAEEQERHLTALRSMLDKRALKREAQRQAQLASRTAKLERERARTMEKIDKQRVKTLRKYAAARRVLQGQGKPGKDRIMDYANATSQVRAPVTRLGKTSGKFQSVITLPGTQLNDITVIDRMERALPADVQTTKHASTAAAVLERSGPLLRTIGRSVSASRPAAKTVAMDGGDMPETVAPMPEVDTMKKKPVTLRPATPEVPPAPYDRDVHDATVLIQRLLRGRAAQNAMFIGKERRLALIKELRLVEVLDADDTALSMLKKHRTEKDAVSIVKHLEGATVSNLLDYYSKEYTRQRQESSIRHVLDMACRIRNRREAEEHGRRQDATERQAKAEARFQAVADAGKGAAHSFISEAAREAVAELSGEQAGSAAMKQAEAIAHRDADIEARYHNNPRAIVRDQLASLLFPHVDRSGVQRQIRIDQGKLRHALQKSVGKSLEKVETGV